MNLVSVIILNWNGLHWLQKFLPILEAHTSPDLATIIIADNASSDGSVQWIEKEHPGIYLIKFDCNYGYSGGYEIVLRSIETKYAVLLNSDVEVTSGWLEGMVSLMEENPKAGAVAPKIRSYSDRNSFEYAGAAGGWIDRFGYPFCRGRIFSSIEEDCGQYEVPSQVFWASGACLLIKTSAYRKAGGLDPLFFAHMEEIDLCWRLHSAGYQVWYTPESVIYHVGGGALPNESPRKLLLNFRNNLLLLRKNLPETNKKRTLLTRKLLDGVAAIQYLLKGKPAYSLAVLNAHRQFTRLWKKEYQNYDAEVHNNPGEIKGWFSGSIVFEFFFKRVKRFGDLRI